MDSIPDHVKNHPSTPTADAHPGQPGADPQDKAKSDVADSEGEAAIAAAMDGVAKQQKQEAVSLDAGQAYPEHTAQVQLLYITFFLSMFS